MMTADHDQVYNIGSGYTCTNNHIIRMIANAMGREVRYDYVEDRLGHDRKYSLNCSKLRSKLLSDWKPKLFCDWIDDSFNERDMVEAYVL